MKEKLLQAFSNLAESLIAAAPKVAIGLVLVLAGWLVAKLVEVGLRFALTRIKFDDLMKKAGLDTTLQRIGIRRELETFIPRLVYFLVLFLLARTASDALGLAAISGAIGAFFSYLPNIIAALLLLVLGSAVAQFAGDAVTQSAASSGIDFAPALGRLVSGVIMFVCAMMAIAQLKIDTDIIRIVTSFVLGGAALAFGLSFGLGTRDIVRNIAAGFYARKVLAIGRPIEISGQRGVLVAITPTHAILESGATQIAVANSSLLDSVSRQDPPAAE
ncbi:MAG: mechanosensitive ion channel [Acidobacteria bacterium]|nr:mechanosensitive ion channel [Acidobacteriota bacterium]